MTQAKSRHSIRQQSMIVSQHTGRAVSQQQHAFGSRLWLATVRKAQSEMSYGTAQRTRHKV